ncbi:MAG: hypothetical protein N4A46_04115, partial [Schleiferiaceae bacterium]|nr:hypothetical protein [Schleiferiaceae bacterium]
VWSERIPKSLKEDSRKAKFYNQFLHKCDVLQCTWFSTLNLLKEQGFTNTEMLRWGMVEEKFADLTDYSPNQFTQNFVSQLPSDDYKFFFPKSVSGGNRHDLIIDACVALKEKGIENYKVYFWLGNFNLEEKIEDYRKKIEANGLTNNIEFVRHEFVNHKDVQHIWRQMDCGLQILDADQLSTSFQEPQLYQKEIIASNIPSYQLFQQHFEVKLDLILNNSGELAKRMEGLITGKYSTNEVEKAKRRNVLLEHYRFNSNMVKILDFFTDFQRS